MGPDYGMKAGELVVLTGLSYRQINYWCQAGYLKPERQGARGRWCWFPAPEVAVAVLMARLTAVGCSPKLAHDVARAGGRLEPGPGITIEIGY